ncbi:copper resistance protein B [Altererythrobacter luteolus]|uniref:Copper resistance protein B n=1 Tax=Pontixanthobacter luteolus TaxID=295089 RepID=A0A6I4V374_9SPHN|nr:copper resistance protein B [Pontixanthobacter luteolus]MXP48155.1 copper resistance protein B [Pontixanthobacter luteolus]
MMRIAAAAILLSGAAPLAAQDHQSHGARQSNGAAQPSTTDEKSTPDQGSMDHRSMDHRQNAEQKPAETHGVMKHGQMNHDAAPAPSAPPPARAFDGPRHAADAIWGERAMAGSRTQLARENGGMTTGVLMVERLEARIVSGEGAMLWDIQGWYGGDLNRVFIKSEGEGELGVSVEDAEIQLLYSRAIGPFFDLQTGAKLDLEPETRSHLVLGVQGLAPYMWHVDAALFLSDRGDLTARGEGEYDQKITQQLILQPRAELELAAQDIPERDLGAGLTKLETGLRLRYEITREFAPYIGVGYETSLGETADIARAQGRGTDGLAFLAGIRAWF